MMTTPIYDFVSSYIASRTSRLHMPGHKGKLFLGCEDRDITEICGADDLYAADGIIEESEANAASLFGAYRTFYSTEGSSHALRAMLYLSISVFPRHRTDGRVTILAARNVHKSFIHACALLDLDAEWLYPDNNEKDSICSCLITADQLEKELAGRMQASVPLPDAFFITSPDYLGNISDIRGLSEVCQRYSIPLLVDNAHGAYLHFLEEPAHPMDLGAAMCCDSAHKTLTALTGGAYLHISSGLPSEQKEKLGVLAKEALSLFGSSSPSYLILQSLDLCNRYLSDGYQKRLDETVQSVGSLKKKLEAAGIPVLSTEPLKLVISLKPLTLTGAAAADILRRHRIECEFADTEYLVLMFTPENPPEDYERVLSACSDLKNMASEAAPFPDMGKILLPVLQKACSIRDAVMLPSEIIPSSAAEGRICALPTVSCPPAVPIAVSGERFDREAVRLLELYGIQKVSVLTDPYAVRYSRQPGR